MSFSSYSSDSDSDRKESKIKSARIMNNSKKKQYTQKFCDRWLDIFKSWLIKDEQNRPYCQACNLVIGCKLHQIAQHERTTKHTRNMEVYLAANGLPPQENERGSSIVPRKRKSVKVIGKQTKPDSFVFERVEIDLDVIDDENLQTDKSTNSTPSKNGLTTARKRNNESSSDKVSKKKHRKDLLLQIKKDNSKMMSYCNEIVSPADKKNDIDVFFDSISLTVKKLSPKLIVEAKMRIFHLVCELELRGIAEPTVPHIAKTRKEEDTFNQDLEKEPTVPHIARTRNEENTFNQDADNDLITAIENIRYTC